MASSSASSASSPRLRLRYDALMQKQIDVANGFATDWQIAAEKFAALKDDKGLFPPYFLAPVVRIETVAANPKAVEALETRRRADRQSDDAGAQPPGRGRQEGAARRRTAEFLKAKGVVR